MDRSLIGGESAARLRESEFGRTGGLFFDVNGVQLLREWRGGVTRERRNDTTLEGPSS